VLTLGDAGGDGNWPQEGKELDELGESGMLGVRNGVDDNIISLLSVAQP